MPSDNFDPKITIRKFFYGLIYAGIPFILLYSIEFLETEEFPPEYAGIVVLIVGVLHLISNAWKHWKD